MTVREIGDTDAGHGMTVLFSDNAYRQLNRQPFLLMVEDAEGGVIGGFFATSEVQGILSRLSGQCGGRIFNFRETDFRGGPLILS